MIIPILPGITNTFASISKVYYNLEMDYYGVVFLKTFIQGI